MATRQQLREAVLSIANAQTDEEWRARVADLQVLVEYPDVRELEIDPEHVQVEYVVDFLVAYRPLYPSTASHEDLIRLIEECRTPGRSEGAASAAHVMLAHALPHPAIYRIVADLNRTPEDVIRDAADRPPSLVTPPPKTTS